MKKILTLSLVLASALFFSQGKLYLQNFSNYDLAMRVVTGSTTNCLPEAIASMNFPANTLDVIDNFNGAFPYTAGWSVRLSATGGTIYQNAPSGLLTSISPLTRWEFAWYQTLYPGTTNVAYDTVNFNMGDPSAFSTNCAWNGSTFIDGSLTDAFWFYIPSENATYLVIQ